ncbi:fumarate reductase subunit FrdD [Phytoactinopolyspora mesophila]|uniref:Fumarate reductase subunit D n=1 Tax=Phytoactinopolyspora mesophila TaxID=2650750 RepID=A0A7K3M7L1_9ACTN|nr:fumarate reductase subunit FrdD [Phytoactinopolyspora mesophila]NDL59037.1 fumarate reductase subunit D [Phytoactinopolyspora mesophila]
MPKRQVEPFAWLAFSAGGVMAALFVPMLLFLFGLAFPLGWISAPSHPELLDLLSHPVSRIVLLGVCVLALLHFAHRFRYTLHDGLQLKAMTGVIGAACYGCAVLGSVAAAYLLVIYL